MGRKRKDVALVYGPADDGEGYKILRERRGSKTLETGTVRPLREGRAISGEVVHLEPRRESPLLFDVETDEELSSVAPLTPPAARQASAGPPQVATDDYRRGWEAIWGPKPRPGPPN
jgi:hypothetical protein